MIRIVRERLERAAPAFAERAQLRVGNFETLELETRRADLITSNMSLHHVAAKGPFYAGLRRALRPGGSLVFGDEVTGAVPYTQALHWNDWLEFATRPGHLTPEQLEECYRHMEAHDHYETLPNQLALLRDAGFSRVDCVWRYLNYAIFVALR